MGGPPVSLDSRLRRVADSLGFALFWTWILVSLLFFPALLGYPILGVLAFIGGVIVCWQAAEASVAPVYTVGSRKRVDTEPVVDEMATCDQCGQPAAGGERKEYTEQRILFGTAVATPEWGVNVYCPDCADGPADSYEANLEARETVSEAPDRSQTGDLEFERESR